MKMAIKIFGDSALLIEFEQIISDEVNAKVIALAKAIESANIDGVIGCTPAYCSIVVKFNPSIVEFGFLEKIIKHLFKNNQKIINNNLGNKLNVPVCYESPCALDIDELSEQLKLEKEELIYLHTNAVFQVFMIGFLPGFPYMGILPKELNCNRKKTPRIKVPARSVGLAGKQTGIYPFESPGGWQVIGQTPLELIDAKRETPFLINIGDTVQFVKIKKQEFDLIRKDVLENKFDYKSIYG